MMDQPQEQRLSFGPFVLERANARLLRDGHDIPLSPKAFDVLAHLAARPDQLVSKDQLLTTVWHDVVVSDASVKVCIREIRKALEDDADSPRFIATVHRRGYRFVAPVNTKPESTAAVSAFVPPAPASRSSAVAESPADHRDAAPPPLLVGRDEELSALFERFALALTGRRQVAFIIGPPGTGKTALVDTFLHQLAEESAAAAGVKSTIAPGHCVEQFGGAEPYLPFWEALAEVGKRRELPPSLLPGDPLREMTAPTATVMATAAAAEDREVATEPRLPSARLMRDLAAGIESLASESPLVLVLEDLHWADYSTLDLVCALARRRSPARLLIVVTYRSGETADRERLLRDLAQDLGGPICRELKLAALDESAVATYLAGRFPGRALPASLARHLHAKTGGQPLFLASLVDELAEGGALDADADALPERSDVPRSVRAFIDNQFERLTADEQRALEAAAVAGVDFSAATAAAALGEDVVSIESTCDQLARRHRFLESAGTADWPDGTLANRYRFIHELYHNAVVARIPAARRVSMHRALGGRLETAWASRAGEEAAAAAAAPELALHFERGCEFAKAVRYLRQCAEHATRQYAHREAIDYLRRALALLERLPAEDRATLELLLLKALVVHVQVTLGFSAPEVRTLQARAYELCGDSKDPVATFPVLWGIWLFHKVRSELRRATMLADKLHAMAERTGDAALLLQSYQAISVTSLCLGEPRRCCEQIERAAAIYDSARHSGNARVYGQDPCVATMAFGGVALWLTGHEGAAVATSERAIQLARDLEQPSSLALALHFAAMLHQFRGDAPAVLGLTDEQVRLSQEEGFSFWLAGGTILRGWARAAIGDSVEGVAQMRSGIDAWLATGSRTYHTYHLGLLADGLSRGGRSREALATIEEALGAAREMPEGIYEAELHRLKARCVLEASGGASQREAAELFARAVELARAQGATVLECRASREAGQYGCDVNRPAILPQDGRLCYADATRARASNGGARRSQKRGDRL